MPLATLIQAQSDSEFACARALMVEYADQLEVDLCFQGFASELQSLGTMYGPPSGCLILARQDEEFVGCVGIRRLSADDCEMKRLYVRNGVRGHRLGLRLAQAAQKSVPRPLDFARLVRTNLMHRRPIDRLLEPPQPIMANRNQLSLALYFQ